MIYGVSPNGKAWGFGSHIVGSNPATLVWQKCQYDYLVMCESFLTN